MNTDAQRRANRKHEDRLKEAGGRKITVRLSPAAVVKLAALKAKIGSSDKAIEAAILGYGTAQAPEVVRAASVASRSRKGPADKAGAAGKPIGWEPDGTPIYKR